MSLFLVGCRTEPAHFVDYPDASPPKDKDQDMIVRAGDVVDIEIAGKTYSAKVQEDGSILLPLNQRFVVEGKTIEDFEEEVHQRYVPDGSDLLFHYSPKLKYYSVQGEIRAPNRYPYLGPTTVLQAIESAGGFSRAANPKKVSIVRKDGTKLEINCLKAQDPALRDLAIFPGDRVVISRKRWW